MSEGHGTTGGACGASYAPREPETLAGLENLIVSTAAMLAATKNKVALAYSGGAESGLLLHLLRPLREALIVVSVDPGTLPGDAEHIARRVEGWPHVARIPMDRVASWREHGLPTKLLPVDLDPASQGDGRYPGLRLQSFNSCCLRVRMVPLVDWARAHGVTLLIHGQRRGEGSGLYAPHVEGGLWGPLATWTRAEVMARVAHHGVPLPPQYAEGSPRSFECAICPADLDPARLGFLRRHYPDHHAETLRLARAVFDAADAVRSTIGADLDAAETVTGG